MKKDKLTDIDTTSNENTGQVDKPYYLRYPTPRINIEESHRSASPILSNKSFDTYNKTYPSDVAEQIENDWKFDMLCAKNICWRNFIKEVFNK